MMRFNSDARWLEAYDMSGALAAVCQHPTPKQPSGAGTLLTAGKRGCDYDTGLGVSVLQIRQMSFKEGQHLAQSHRTSERWTGAVTQALPPGVSSCKGPAVTAHVGLA